MNNQEKSENNVPLCLKAGMLVVILLTSTLKVNAVELHPELRPILISNLAAIVKSSVVTEQRQHSRTSISTSKLVSSNFVIEAGKLLPFAGNEPVTLAWTNLELEMFVKHKIMPGRSARALALMHVAMHDALVAARSNKKNGMPTEHKAEITSRISPLEYAAVAGAATSILGYLFPSEQGYFDSLANEAVKAHMAVPKLTNESEAGLRIGRAVASVVIAYGQEDGAARGWNGEKLTWHGEGQPFGPGHWEPTPPYNYYPPDEPYAPTWKPWLLERADQFRPVPPVYGSDRYMRALQEVKDISEKLTDEQKRIAKFWVDGYGSVTPPGHWNQIAVELIRKYQLEDLATARLFAYLNIALADTYIAAWDAKYAYWTVRPITAIRSLFGVNFNSFILTPPFPSYISGHAAFSGAASEFLSGVFPKDADRLRAMGEEAAMSRLYGGIHYRFDNDDGLKVGRTIGALAFGKHIQGVITLLDMGKHSKTD
jgi:hypothetical protein